jgi:hypothetical protein
LRSPPILLLNLIPSRTEPSKPGAQNAGCREERWHEGISSETGLPDRVTKLDESEYLWEGIIGEGLEEVPDPSLDLLAISDFLLQPQQLRKFHRQSACTITKTSKDGYSS